MLIIDVCDQLDVVFCISRHIYISKFIVIGYNDIITNIYHV